MSIYSTFHDTSSHRNYYWASCGGGDGGRRLGSAFGADQLPIYCTRPVNWTTPFELPVPCHPRVYRPDCCLERFQLHDWTTPLVTILVAVVVLDVSGSTKVHLSLLLLLLLLLPSRWGAFSIASTWT